MNKYTHQTAPTQFLEANGIRFAYRRFGKANGVPLVFNQHYLGTMDYWDPIVTDGLARDREVINGAEHPVCGADHLPRRQSRLTAPVPGALR